MSCSGSNILSMAGCGACAETGPYVAPRSLQVGEGGGYAPTPTTNDCNTFPSFGDIWTWAENYPDPAACSADGSSWVPMGHSIEGIFTSDTLCPDSENTYSTPGLSPPANSAFRITCAPCDIAFQRVQVGFQYPTTYWIIETYSSVCSGPVYINRGCLGYVAGDVSYVPVELGLPYISGTAECPIPGCRCSSTYAGGTSNRFIFAPANGQDSGGTTWVPIATSAGNAATQAGVLSGGGTVFYNTGWYLGACNPPNEDPFDSGLP